MNTRALMSTNNSLPKIKLHDLMRGQKKLILEHGDKPYMLSITRKGKLILTAAGDGAPVTQNKPPPCRY